MGHPDIRLFLSTVKWALLPMGIRAVTRCDYSHTGFIRLSDRWTFSADTDGGVRWRKPELRAKILILDAFGIDEAFEKMLTLEGRPYDWLNILGIFLGRNWSCADRMICDRAVFWSFAEAGCPLLNHTLYPLEHLAPDDILKSLNVWEDKTA